MKELENYTVSEIKVPETSSKRPWDIQYPKDVLYHSAHWKFAVYY